jgi:hypothetical protein
MLRMHSRCRCFAHVFGICPDAPFTRSGWPTTTSLLPT